MKCAIFTPPSGLTQYVAGLQQLFVLVFAIALVTFPLMSVAQDSWRYPSVTSSETRYVATNYNGGSGANPIATVVASTMIGSGFNVKFVRQDGAIAFQYNYNAIK